MAGCPTPKYTDERGSTCYWVPDDIKNGTERGINLGGAKRLCVRHGGHLAAPFTKQRLQHIHDKDILNGTGDIR